MGTKGELALKNDISEAYDIMDWSFLRRVLSRLGFADRWIHWGGVETRRFVVTVSFHPDWLRANLSEVNYLMEILRQYADASDVKRFLVGDGGQNKGIRWLAWDRMTCAKEEGGLGFRDFKAFNREMVTNRG
ncbi:hypothetical protein KIW84_043999 [Lathyrus oleraceus]|uniref:Uncharacterized protein n=1 Tax=Pisum sativum TaxID=3888 RepID=A0A9D4XH72_PEA|nr:hypothetical protein KIW84_043999 [Pisum sativum]